MRKFKTNIFTSENFPIYGTILDFSPDLKQGLSPALSPSPLLPLPPPPPPPLPPPGWKTRAAALSQSWASGVAASLCWARWWSSCAPSPAGPSSGPWSLPSPGCSRSGRTLIYSEWLHCGGSSYHSDFNYLNKILFNFVRIVRVTTVAGPYKN